MDALEPLEFFTRAELTHGHWDECPLAVRDNLINFGVMTLDPWRVRCGPLRISSGWRTEEHNASIPGAAPDSWHIPGWAVDVVPRGVPLWRALWLLDGLPFDKAIIYPKDGHIHVQATAPGGPNNGQNRYLWYRKGNAGERPYVQLQRAFVFERGSV